ncbi:response regulator transcription factor [Ulvibacter litoralis]|uniref:DNA-binding response regulator, NarL/FixJ family, contains REC and HTH domains n=1 Tax=Ulvibacter litoralis TaxID=227084 RepID=A0A1G7D1T7_9FLAO|nr:response regulator transcription factor [Ulvibacter litoralis]GHC45176.1 DNA-binding response regulator [Ulvibacter litoralis]SDE45538.1 DNA-binding response regulator, NarL/FixJ family, contains REC and HTH domains [Ulvibacter litoralis]
MSSILVSIVDDDSLILSLLEDFVNAQSGFEVIFTATSGEEFLSKIKLQDLKPQVVLLDFKMKELNGAEVTSLLKQSYPDIEVIVMSSFYKLSFMGFMLKTGVSAFIPKGISQQQLINVIREVHEKGISFMPDQVDMMREQISSKSPKPLAARKNPLTEREAEVLKLICLQKTAKEISDKLFISPRTVEGHKSNLLLKTEAKNIAGLVIYALQNNYVTIDEIPLI